MIDTAFLKVSDGTGEAVLAHVQTNRLVGATTLDVDTVSKWSAKYIVTTGTLNADGFIDPATMTVMKAHTVAGDIVIDSFAPGYSDIGNTAGQVAVIKPTTYQADTIVNALDAIDADVRLRESETVRDHFNSGGIWTQIAAGLSGSMTALVAYQSGYRGTVAAVATRAFTASKDTYVDVLRTTGITSVTMTLVYTEVLNGAASPALAANSVRLAKVVTSGTAITSITQNNLDSLGNTIRPGSTFRTLHLKSELVSGVYFTNLGQQYDIFNFDIAAASLPGEGTYWAYVFASLNITHQGLGGYSDQAYRLLLDSVGIYGYATNTMQAAQYGQGFPVIDVIPLSANTAHNLKLQGLRSNGNAADGVNSGASRITILIVKE